MVLRPRLVQTIYDGYKSIIYRTKLSRTGYVPLCGMVLRQNRDLSSVLKEAEAFKKLIDTSGHSGFIKILCYPFQPDFIYLGVLLRGQE